MTITLTREEAQQVLDSLEAEHRWLESLNTGKTMRAIETLRARLAQPELEPVAWSVTLEGEHIGNFYIKQQDAEEAMHDLNKDWPQWVRKVVPLYTAPPQREWQGLTDEEILEEYRQSYGDDGNLTDVYFARAIEAKLKEKNA
jgi:hypothetical protein